MEPSLLHDHHVRHAGQRKTVRVSEGEQQLQSPKSPSLGQGASYQRLPVDQITHHHQYLINS